MPAKVLGFTDVNDATVLTTMFTRGSNAVNIDGSKATTSDKVFAMAGAVLPFVSGSAVKKAVGAVVDKVSDLVKNSDKVDDVVRLRHYTSNKGLEGIMNDKTIKAYDQNTVFAEKAKGKALSAADASSKYGISKGSARNYVEFSVPSNQVGIIKNANTQATEYVIKGDVKLDEATKFIKRN